MSVAINGSGTITGISVGGLPDGTITGAELNGAQTGTAPIYGCRAWVSFDGTRNEADTGASTNGANVKIRGSGNVTSVLKNGTGDYTVNFTTAMVDANYSAIVTNGSDNTSNSSWVGANGLGGNTAPASGSIRVGAWAGGGGVANRTATDFAYLSVAIFR